VRQDRGGLVIRLTRFTITTSSTANGRAAITEGTVVGLRAAPDDVHVLHPSS
jgi:hypothetical protein